MGFVMKENKTRYFVKRNQLKLGEYFLLDNEAFLVSNRGDISLSSGISISVDAERLVEIINVELIFTRSSNGAPQSEYIKQDTKENKS